ncbi:MAG: hypothetical protein QNJ70_10485 [Xenococcaceae cyanobacterium MO_207.B15]|nr:hypothetical protein [Xenococcaceae cyanobacterium MO_207.B15]
MKKLSQIVANFLETISIAIEPKIARDEFTKMKRKELIATLKAQRQQISELKQSQEDLLNQILELINELHKINNGNLSTRLRVTACFIGYLADCINLIVEDLSEAVEYLPPEHPITQKYFLQ